MAASQRVFKVRRHYNRWVADQTMEDYALRFTARKGRHMSIEMVGKTALGATAFLALEGIAAAVTLNYGFYNTVLAMFTVCLMFFITGFPITYYSAKHGLDIDLLTRGAGFGYLGSTITSLIYASFTFIFFAIEAAILASALQALFGIPLPIGYFLCAVAVIPIVVHGIGAISKFQAGTQTLWLLLQCSALFVVVWYESAKIPDWTSFAPVEGADHFNVMLFGAAASVFFAMVAQIGEQVDYLRFLPEKTEENKRRWWFWLVLAGPGWVVVGLIKMLLGSFLAYLAISQGASWFVASDPTYMYQRVFAYLTHSPSVSLLLAGLMVIISQMKINVTNAYAGSIAWSNFFSRVTHSHPGRVVWLVFNVTISLILMELGIYRALEAILGIFAIVAVSWLGSVAADLLINKPLGLSPSFPEFKRAHLYDINPVGMGSMILATTAGLLCYLGVFGPELSQLSHFVSLGVCFVSVPAIAWLTGGRFYIARQSLELIPVVVENKVRAEQAGEYVRLQNASSLRCVICENEFELEDMSHCTAYENPICSLCCSLDVRCLDSCKPKARLSDQVIGFLHLFLPPKWVRRVNSRLGRFAGLWAVLGLLNAAVLSLVSRQLHPLNGEEHELLSQAIYMLYFILLIVSGVVAWLFILAHESRLVAQTESNRQTRKLVREIEAHKVTDRALQDAKELAERANHAKSRYLSGISHELRTPLQAIIGYAELLQQSAAQGNVGPRQSDALSIIQRSGLYLADLIEGLLDISKIEAGRLALNDNQVRLPELISQLADMFQVQATEKNIEFECVVVDALPAVVRTDEKRLRQILINLLSNAIKYTATGRVRFEVRYRNQVAEFVIEDTGPGIESGDLERIFQPFERIRNIHTVNLPGTGLGLTIVRLLCDIMGGDLKVQSEPGKGSVFAASLMLPWVNNPVAVSDPVHAMTGYEGERRTVLLVDDDAVLRGFLGDLLSPLGFNVLEAPDGLAGLSILNQITPDLFLLDVAMPNMDGLTLARKIREQGIESPILMLSADVQEQQRDADAKKTFNDYLIKPIRTGKLLEKIASVMDLKWTYSVQSLPEPTRTKAASRPQELGLVASEALDELRSCCEIGYPRGVREALARLADEQTLSPDTLNYFEELCRGLQFEALAKCLEPQP